MIVDAIQFRGHTCFRTGWSGFDTVKPINVIIGRNNSGKSHLLDLVETLCSGQFDQHGWQYRCKGTLDQSSLQRLFHAHAGGGDLGGFDPWHDHGRHFVGVQVEWETDERGEARELEFLNGFRPESPLGTRSTKARLEAIQDVVRAKAHRLTGKSLRRLVADRDIETEPSTVNLSLDHRGRGATNIVRRLLNTANQELSRELIRRDLLDALNTVFVPDGRFTEIQVKEHDERGASDARYDWEIHLGEAAKGLVPLSRSGSGLKTILLVLLNLLVIPELAKPGKKEKSRFVFAFEELENNLHPALLRRLFRYLEGYVLNEQATIFLTTHSSTALDFFGASEHAQIIRVSHDGESAHAEPVGAHFDRLGLVTELGARPSDLLLANGIVWLEGPSDRIYLNRWLELCAGGALREGQDYQCAFYGGSLLARAQFTSSETAGTELANLLQVNPNVLVICDSDRASRRAPLKQRVRRIRDEVGRTPGGQVWITVAREIENYVPGVALGKALNRSPFPDPEQFESFFPRARSPRPSYVERRLNGKHQDKVELASLVAPHMTLEVMRSRFDWQEQMARIVERIESWNE